MRIDGHADMIISMNSLIFIAHLYIIKRCIQDTHIVESENYIIRVRAEEKFSNFSQSDHRKIY